MSIKWRLMLLAAGAALLVWLCANLYLYKRALDEVEALYDLHLAQSAHLLMAVVAASAEHDDLGRLQSLLPALVPAITSSAHTLTAHSAVDAANHERELAYQVLDRGGAIRIASTAAPAEPLARGVGGFSNSDIGGTRWRVYGVADPGHRLVLYAGEERAVRERLSAHMVDHLLLPSLLAMPPLLLLFWLAVGKGLAPLKRLVQEIRRRAPRDLLPLRQTERPLELVPLVDGINSLMNRLERALESERSFAGSAAHELRTPLAALRVHAQVAQRAVSDAQRERALAQVIAGVDQAGHLVDQLLTLSRLEGQGAVTMDGEVSLTGTARRCAEDLEPMAQDRSVSLRVTGADDVVARGNEDAIYILLRNLIDNAIRYTPAGGEVSVMVRRWGLFSRIIIDDSGPGIADGQADDMFQRFRRGPDTGMPGSGLGLSIARQICEFHGGGVQLENREEGGLRCDVWLPVPTEPAADGSDAKDGLAEPRGFWQRCRQFVGSVLAHTARGRRRTD